MAHAPESPEVERWLDLHLEAEDQLWVLHADLATALGFLVLDQPDGAPALTPRQAQERLHRVQSSLNQLEQIRSRYPNQVTGLDTAALWAQGQLTLGLEPIQAVWPGFDIQLLADRLAQLQQQLPISLLTLSASALLDPDEHLQSIAMDPIHRWLEAQAEHQRLLADHNSLQGENRDLRHHLAHSQLERQQLNHELQHYVNEHLQTLQLLPELENQLRQTSSALLHKS